MVKGVPTCLRGPEGGGGVLMQEGHPIAFESWKLNETERRYTVQEKEMTTIVHYLRIWRHYLLGSRFVVKTDNVATSYFQTQKKLSPKQARWQDFLAEFDYVLEYKPGKANVVADALSRKAELAAISLAKGNVHEKIKEGLEHDPMAKELMRLAKEGKTRQFWVEDGLLYTKGRRLYVPKWGNLRRTLLESDGVEVYVRTCLVCQQDKTVNQQPAGLLEPLPIPNRPWESISMDFISALPKFEGFGSIMVVIDRFSKYGSFIACSRDCTAEEAARAFFKNVVNFHPQTDGQTEKVNALLECYLRHFVSANQHDWAKILDVAQFSNNLQRSEATGKSPFELATGQQPLTPHTLAISFDSARCPRVAKMAKSWAEQSDLAKSFLEKARRKMKKWADPKRRHLEFNVGDKVLIKLIPQQFKAFRGMHKGLVRKYEGPYPVVAKVGKVSYRLDLPSTLKIHSVFHVSMLRPYQEDEEDPSRGESHRAPPVVTKSFDKEMKRCYLTSPSLIVLPLPQFNSLSSASTAFQRRTGGFLIMGGGAWRRYLCPSDLRPLPLSEQLGKNDFVAISATITGAKKTILNSLLRWISTASSEILLAVNNGKSNVAYIGA
ncbi:hypothetical protein BUALT_Bualt05G0083800 [Buddleja alternifolia]|uniref:Reverse transcriptase RNase H-like domain-containing protein n=1 Tax=Buddleja alternifolia TaxID=168488 RepID=A0AAV6XPK2_9LAMI|nr:hypothetical protein BUALT_Bualt05G0083800 [Buddleja alternifolia]